MNQNGTFNFLSYDYSGGRLVRWLLNISLRARIYYYYYFTNLPKGRNINF